MRVPRKTILAVGLALMVVACAESGRQAAGGDDEQLSTSELQQYRKSVIQVQMDTLVWWMDATRKILVKYNSEIDALLAAHSEVIIGMDTVPRPEDDPPPIPCPGSPPRCSW